VFEEVSGAILSFSFGKVNTEEERELVKANEIRSVPSLSNYRQGVLLFREPAYLDADSLYEVLTQASSLDLDAVRAELAKYTSRNEQSTSKQR
jgi:thioredoxin 1